MSVLLAGAVCEALWRLVPARLSVTTDIVGYPIFADYAYNRYFDAFYIVGLALPLLAVVLYAVLPVARVRPPARPRVPVRPVALVTPDDADADGDPRAPALVGALRRAARLAVPALTVGLCVGVAGAGQGRHLAGWGAGAGLVTLVAVVLSAQVLARRRSPGERARVLAAVNGAGALVAVPVLYAVSRSTAVVVTAGHTVHRYPWLPLWLVLPVLGAAVLWYRRRLRRASTVGEVDDAEAAALTYVAGPVLLFVLIASLAGPSDTTFFAFDDAQSFTSATLTFGHGLFPWRDLYVIHGLFPDVLAGQLGLSVFDPSRWGSTAGLTMFLIPLLWISAYLFVAYVARRNRLLVAAFVAVAALWLTSGRLAGAGLVLGRDIQAFTSGYFRFAFVPLSLILFDQTIRRRSPARCAGLVAVLGAQAILVPETALMAAGILATLVVMEWLGRDPARGWAGSMVRTRWCALFGVLFLGVWAAFLAVTGSLGGFVDYYRVFGPGHALSGAMPANWIGTQVGYTVELVVPVVLVALTMVRVAALVLRRRPWDPRDWVVVAAAISVVLFYQKVLGRADGAHVAEVFTVALPLVLVWVALACETLDGVGRRALGRAGGRVGHAGVRRPATVVLAVVLVALAPGPLGTLRALPARYHVTAATGPELPRLGYAVPGTVDLTMVRDLGTVLQRYAGSGGAVFDFTDEPGLLYYLLDRVPGTRFFHVSMADTGFAQQQLIADLRRSRPRVVVFTSQGIGLPAWDGIEATVRHYDVSDYLLDNYRPLVEVDGQFVMVRADLAASALPLPALAGPVTTQDLYLSSPMCDWGFSPNFLAHPTSLGSAPGLAVGTSVVASATVSMAGWSLDTARRLPPVRVLAVRAGRVVASVVPNGPRLDVWVHTGDVGALASGFTMILPAGGAGPVSLYGLNPDGTVSPLPVAPTAPADLVVPGGTAPVITADGTVHAVSSESTGSGSAAPSTERLLSLDVPAGTDLARYHWLELSAPEDVGRGAYSVADGLDPSTSLIAFRSLPRAGAHLFVQVGSCPQWRAFTAAGLTLVEGGGRASAPVVRLVS